jgi:hypothetical protein
MTRASCASSAPPLGLLKARSNGRSVTGPAIRHRKPAAAGCSRGGGCRSCLKDLDPQVLTITRPELSLTPDLLEVAAASQTAISASELVLERHATYFGFDPGPYTRKSRQRRTMLDTLMREQFVRQAANPAPLIIAKS